ncbi:30S ribosomal protein S20 [Alicyclobacillus mali]|uniref:Small ribosomal subunit protein bS20 n=1 Tax=Alicyclobacillus mali (ex Roth et al. 2021) TaxID=1123961 RepID=A0ABS0F4L5_9BACL|nr:30S ribosomal protein S20 [Alicyclobacillus mali (ex Roth et al. 2021)]MBF8378240.1 30S ribosomal protein S20 [Alicyclobacillus mali (ex Roth et al. 2021)]MCL6487609.1 30S ribosomal protein S20 [Alicyclobacillus mali (ex Roth et al. 2021)]
MANIKSAKKRVLITKRNTLRNRTIKSALRTHIRKFETAFAAQDVEEAQARLRTALRALDKAVTKGVIHRNTAARKKSRLAKRLNALLNEKQAQQA